MNAQLSEALEHAAPWQCAVVALGCIQLARDDKRLFDALTDLAGASPKPAVMGFDPIDLALVAAMHTLPDEERRWWGRLLCHLIMIGDLEVIERAKGLARRRVCH